MKKLLLTFLMLIAAVPLWAHDFEVDGIYYNITSETTVGVTYRGSYGHEYSNEYTGSVTIPSSVIYNSNTYSVTTIGLSAFSGCPELTEVTIPNSVTTIGADAFFDCSGLIEVTIPNSVTFIDIQAFQFCRGLTSIIIPNSVTTIGDAAFRYCSKLTSITIPNSVTTIGDYAFSGCTGLTEVIIPNSVTTIGNEAFKGCYGLTKVTIPNSVITIGSYAFQSCSGLTEIAIPNSVTSIGDEAFSYCSGLTSVTIGNSVTSIGDFAFYACTRLTGITIPNSITSIGEGAFSNCFSFGYIVVESGNGVFDSRDNCNAVIETATNTLVNGCKNSVIPNSVTSIGDYAFYQCRDLTKVTIPNSVTLIGDAAFNGCSGLTKLILEDGEESITGLSFPNSPIETLYLGRNTSEEFVEGNYTLKELIIGKSVTSISNLVFSGCSGLTKLILEDGEESITGLSFPDSPIETLYLGRNTSEEFVKGKYTLKELIISKSVTSIGNLVFNGCNRLTKLILEDGEESISGLSFPDSPIETLYLGRNTSDAFVKGKTTFKELVIGDSVTIIGSDAFSGCTGLMSVAIGNSVNTIETSAFNGCAGLTEVTIPNSVTTIGSSAFSGCTGLTELTIPNSVTTIGSSAISGCTGLTEVTIPNSVTTIGSSAFSGCTGLAEVTIPNSVSTIGPSTFSNCSGLTSINIPNTVTSIGNSALSGCAILTEVTIPSSVTLIGDAAFNGCSGLTKLILEDGEESITGLSFPDSPIETLYLGRNTSDVFVAKKTTLVELVIGDSVTIIGSNAFSGCTGLTEVTIPNSVNTIGSFAFRGCQRLFSVSIPNSVTTIGYSAFISCYSLSEVTIGNSVTSIGERAFNECSNLTILRLEDGTESITGLSFPDSPIETLYLGRNTSDAFVKGKTTFKELVIGDSVTIIGSDAFSGCTGLMSVAIGNSVNTIETSAFNGCVGLTEVTIPNSVITISASAFNGCTGLTEVTIPNSVSTIGNEAFNGCTGLNSVTIGNSVNTIGSNVFSGCNSLNIVNFNAENCKQMVSAESSVFSDCSNLKLINIGNSVKILPNNAFSGCTGLTEITIPNSVTSIGSDAFKGCTGLNDVNIEDLSAWCKIDFGNDSANPLSYAKKLNLNRTEITGLIIPNDITEIKGYSFYNCAGLTYITVPNSVTSIGNSAFNGCNGLTKLVLEDGTEQISGLSFPDSPIETLYLGRNTISAFVGGKTTLKEVTIGNSITEIGNSAFNGCSGLTEVTIPNSVTAIGASAFWNCTGLAKVSIGNSVVTIGSSAFKNCTGLTEVIIPNSVTTIGNEAFNGCTSLKGTLIIPQSVTSIGNDTFNKCYGLNELIIADGTEVLTLGYCNDLYEGYWRKGLFGDCRLEKLYLGRNLNYETTPDYNTSPFYRNATLKEVVIGNTVTSISNKAFLVCSLMTSVTIPNSVTTIGDYAFSGCTGLTEVTIPNSVTTIGSYAFYDCKGLTEITIPNSVKTIGTYAFERCSDLTSISIGNSVTSIGDGAFSRCSIIAIVNSYNTTAPTGAPFENVVKQSAILNVPSSALASYQTTKGWKDFANIREMAMNGYYDFDVDGIYYRIISLTDLTVEVVAKDDTYNSYAGDVVIPETVSYRNREFNVISIGAMAFSRCSGLTSIKMPQTVSTIGKLAFDGCSGLKSITIPQTVSTIGKLAFDGCSGLKSITIADSDNLLNTNGTFASLPIETLYLGRKIDVIFNGCTTLQKVEIGKNVTEIKENMFSGCITLMVAELSEGVTIVGASAFNGCTSLASIAIPGSVATIGESAFMNCNALTQVELSEGVTTVGASAFNGCTSLTTIKIPGSVTTIGESAFMNCNALTQVELSEGVTTVGASAFDGCTSLASIAIPGSVTTIGGSVFSGCTALVDVIFKNGKDAIDMGGNTFKENPLVSLYIDRTMTNVKSPFNGITTLEKVTLGSGMTSLQSDAFVGCKGIKELIIEGGEGAITIDCKFNDSPIEKLHIGRNGTYAFNNRIELKEVSVGDNVTILPNNAFNGCSNITTLKLGKKLEKIGSGAFTGCATLMNVYSTNLTPPTGAVFENKTYLQGTLYVVKGSKAAYEAADGWKEFWEIVDNLPFEVNGIWYNIDENGNANVVGNPSNDAYVGEISIPASVEVDGIVFPVTSIDAEAFANALNVTSITIEDSNQPLTIGAPATAIVAMSNDQAGTFEACMLDSVYVGRNLNYATAPFANIASLKKVVVGALVTSMGGAMFAGCENIETVYALSAIPATDAEFESRVYDHATLVVPVGAVAYTTTDGWKEFVNVITTESSMVEDINIEAVTGNVSIIAVNGEIIVKGAEDAQIAVYNVNGGLIYHGLNRPVAVANKGVYVVVVNGIAMKVML